MRVHYDSPPLSLFLQKRPVPVRTLAIPVFFVLLLAACSGETEVKQDTAPRKPDTTEKKAQAPKPKQKKGLLFPFEIVKNTKAPFDDAVVMHAHKIYYSTFKGKVSVADTTGANRTDLFDIKAEYLVDKIYIHPLDSDFVVFWQETDHKGVKSYAGRFRRNTVKPVWKNTYKVPNVGPPVIDGRNAYITAAGTIGKINLDNGAELWKCDTLFNKYSMAYFRFERPRVYDSTVVFVELVTRNRKRTDSLCVNAANGSRLPFPK